MTSHLEVNQANDLLEVQEQVKSYPLLVSVPAKVISYIFHPVFIPVYLFITLLKIDAYLFAGFSDWQRGSLLGTFVLLYIFFPLVSVLLMKGLGFVSSIHLTTQRDRIIPYVVCMIYYWWGWYVMNNRAEIPRECVVLSLAIFLSSIGGLLANISMKVSMHAMAAGVMVAYLLFLGLSQFSNFGLYISLAILVAGAVCTARLIDGGHTKKEIYWGLFIGFASVFISSKFAI